MTDHPEFPQESPAMKYVIAQVSKIEEAQACSTGYYKSLGKVLARLDKTDTALVQLQQSTSDLKKVVSFDLIGFAINKKSDEINTTVREQLDLINMQNVNVVATSLHSIRYDNKLVVENLQLLMREIRSTNKKMAEQIAAVDNCLVIPSWKAGVYAVVLIVVGVLIGRFL